MPHEPVTQPPWFGQAREARDLSGGALLDRMVAAQALVHRATIVTTNADDFRDMPGLRIAAC